MGVAAGYKVDLILPFLKSLRQTSYQGRVCLFVGQMTDEAIKRIKMYAEEVVILDGGYGRHIARHRLNGYTKLLSWVRRTPRIRRMYPGLFRATLKLAKPTRRKSLQLDLEQALEGYQALRYHLYQTYLETVAPATDFVMLTDVRDVIFQDDPFARRRVAELEVFLEARHLHIGTEPFNQRWISNLYGQDMLRALHDKTISCSGTVLGTRAGILRYLQTMSAEILRHERPLGSHDQGAHNYLLYNGSLEPVSIYANGHGPVLTLGGEKEITRNAQGRLLNKDNTIVPVVHQYDRHPALAQELWRSMEQEPPLAP